MYSWDLKLPNKLEKSCLPLLRNDSAGITINLGVAAEASRTQHNLYDPTLIDQNWL